MAKKKDDAEGDAEGDAKGGGLGGKLKLVAMILPTVLLVVGGVYFLVLAPKGGSSTAAKASTAASATVAGGVAAPEAGLPAEPGAVAQIMNPLTQSTYAPGKILSVDPVTVNLANGHFLKIGVGLQETLDAGEEVSPAPAIDCIITEFSGKTVDELATHEGRDAARKALLTMIYTAYEKKVFKVYFNSFVMN